MKTMAQPLFGFLVPFLIFNLKTEDQDAVGETNKPKQHCRNGMAS